MVRSIISHVSMEGNQMRLAGLALMASGLLLSSVAHAAAPKDLGTFGHWRAVTLKESGKKQCYMLSFPLESLPREVVRNGKKTVVNHGDVYFMVLNSPADKVRHESSFNVGYWLKDNSKVSVKIDKKPPVSLFTQNFTEKTDGGKADHKAAAWAESVKHDQTLTKTMKAGNVMLVQGESRRGTRTKYKFSLKGFTAALNAVNKACK